MQELQWPCTARHRGEIERPGQEIPNSYFMESHCIPLSPWLCWLLEEASTLSIPWEFSPLRIPCDYWEKKAWSLSANVSARIRVNGMVDRRYMLVEGGFLLSTFFFLVNRHSYAIVYFIFCTCWRGTSAFYVLKYVTITPPNLFDANVESALRLLFSLKTKEMAKMRLLAI